VLQFDRMEEIGAPLDQSTDLVAFIGVSSPFPIAVRRSPNAAAQSCGVVSVRAVK
jgi:hypothetical protein